MSKSVFACMVPHSVLFSILMNHTYQKLSLPCPSNTTKSIEMILKLIMSSTSYLHSIASIHTISFDFNHDQSHLVCFQSRSAVTSLLSIQHAQSLIKPYKPCSNSNAAISPFFLQFQLLRPYSLPIAPH